MKQKKEKKPSELSVLLCYTALSCADKIVMLKDEKAAEERRPEEFLQNHNSHFHRNGTLRFSCAEWSI